MPMITVRSSGSAIGLGFSTISGGITVFDNFDRSDGSLGSTSTGNLPWQVLLGSFAIASNKAVSSPSTATSGLAVVDNLTPNVNLSLDVSPTGGDAIYFRVDDAYNWWRAGIDSVTTSSQQAYGHTEYYWNAYRSGAEYYPTSQELANGCWQTYHDHSSDWPTRSGWGTSSTTPPASVAYSDYTHSHSVVLDNCGATVTYSHTHYQGSYYSSTQFVIDGYTTVYTTIKTLRLQKNINNSVSNIGSYQSSSISSIQVAADASSIIVKTSNNATNRISTTSTDLINETKHGFGRATTSDSGTSIDNFSAIPIEV